MEKQQTEEGKHLEEAENAVFLVEGWANYGDIDGKLVYKGVVGLWVITVRVPVGAASSESSRAEAVVHHVTRNETISLSPHMSRVTLRRARQDELRRALRLEWKPPRRKRGFR
jgi:hypothetical protein